MQAAPLQLKAIIPRKFQIEAKTGPKFAKNTTVTVTHEFRRREDASKQWVVIFGLKFYSVEDLPTQYEGEIELMGVFDVISDVEEEKHLKIVSTTCPTMLYGAAREMVMNFSARSANGTFLLPTVSFVDLRLENSGAPSLPPLGTSGASDPTLT